ncbi:methyltransferase domain-containing protein [Kocuria massiliensis]|uniref:methyltransferase domain-containing protein n=1 Tax=Kocuria massiliensis TaxID=1926282 RepID=UPI0022B95F42|nr:methyltransferase domain-containing protein [Kocuria massiliensis]
MTEPYSQRSLQDYSHGHHRSVLASHATRTARNSCGYFLDRIAPGDRILDIGCGPGTISTDLAGIVGATGSVLGIDVSGVAIEEARSHARASGVPNASFEVGDLFGLAEDAGGFDIVHAHQVLQHLSRPVEALRAMVRLCRPGGIVAVRDADYGAMTWFPESSGMDRWLSVYSSGARLRGGEPDAGRRLRRWARLAEANVASIGTSTWTYATPEDTAWWGGSQAERVRSSKFAEQAREQGVDQSEIDEMVAAWQRWGDDPDAWFCMVHTDLVLRA